MSIQYIWDMSASLDINRRKLVGIQYVRNQSPRTDLTVTKNPWRFTLTVPGLPWNRMRGVMESLDALDRYQPQTITVGSNNRFNWLYSYMGDAGTTPTGFTVSSFVGNQLSIANVTGFSSGQYIFRAGDMVQINNFPYPYTVVNDVVATGSTTYLLTTHRPNIISGSVAGQSLRVGKNCQITVFMPELPTYKLMPGALTTNDAGEVTNNAIVEFTGPISLYEYVANS